MEDYRKLAMEAAMKIPYQTHSELLTSADKIYAWLTQKQTSRLTTEQIAQLVGPPYKKSPSDIDEEILIAARRLGSNSRF